MYPYEVEVVESAFPLSSLQLAVFKDSMYVDVGEGVDNGFVGFGVTGASVSGGSVGLFVGLLVGAATGADTGLLVSIG